LSKSRTKLLMLFAFFCVNWIWSQVNVPPNIEAEGDQLYCPLSQINIVTSFDIIDPDDTEIDAVHIQVSTGYISSQDQLTLTGVHPNIVATWNNVQGKLSLRGLGGAPISYTDIIAAVNDIVFESTSVNISGEKQFSFTIGDANYLPSTGHYYEYVPDIGVTWTQARTNAAGRSYFGLEGYLATITSADEAQLSGEQAAGAGWIGGSDSQTEGTWKWMTGPEAGETFWIGGINGSTPTGAFEFWNNGEPNNSGDEDYAHITAIGIGVNGSWNDLSNTGALSGPYQPKGYIVEYGGMPNDPIVDISASTKISIATIIGTTPAEICGPGSLTLEAIPSTGTVVWFDTLTGGTQLGTGLTFTTPVINTSTTYYALTSVNGCLEGQREAVVATIKIIPTIISIAGDLVCENGSGTLTAAASNGAVFWYDQPTGGLALNTGNNFITPVLNATTTYYVEAQFNGCISITRTPVIIEVQHTTSPTATPLQTFCDLDNATIANLVITGSNTLWYATNNGGTALNPSEVLNTTTYYASQTINGCESPLRISVDVIIYETVNVPAPSNIPALQECDTVIGGSDTDGFTVFDLSLYDDLLLNGALASDYIISYYLDVNYTLDIVNPVAFPNTIQNGQTIYIRIANNLDNTCFTETSFNVQVDPLPVIQSDIIFKNCDEDGVPDGFTDYNLNEINTIISSEVGLSFSYYLSLADANTATNPVNPVPFNNATANIVYARAENVNGCFRVSTINLQVSTTAFPVGYLQELETCDDDDIIDGFHVFNLTAASPLFLAEFPTGQNLSVYYYRTLNDAQLEQNEITNPSNYINETAFNQLLYVRVESDDNGACFGIGQHLSITVHPRPEFEVDQSSIFCLNGDPIILETYAPQGNYTYQWTNESGLVISNLSNATITSGGVYSVIAISNQGCESFPVSFNVVESSIADISLDDITVVDFTNNNSISINTDNNNLGIGDYEFALDDVFGPYQDTPFFDQVGAGAHRLYVRDKKGCGTAQIEVFVLGFPKYFTPNDDGYHDTWNIKGWSNAFAQSSTLFIYDRYGKLIKQLSPWSSGWNGTFNGYKLAATDYWFVANLVSLDGISRVLKGHFSLVR